MWHWLASLSLPLWYSIYICLIFLVCSIVHLRCLILLRTGLLILGPSAFFITTCYPLTKTLERETLGSLLSNFVETRDLQNF